MNETSHAEIRTIARSYFEDAQPAHDWNHVVRVKRLAETLLEDRDDACETVVELAVYLHDIGRTREAAGSIEDHATWGATEARSILARYDPATVDAVCHCIRAHRYSNDVDPETPEAKLVSDADNLDAIGAIGIARAIAHGSEYGQPIHDPVYVDRNARAVSTDSTVAHVESKLLSLRDRMYTDAGRELAERRHAYVEEFLERLARETGESV
ncbi:HD domain-containing protein [Halovivax gelatinilyticus]|uniref:HD domain-containing protein n=1 Tax=Halovivax gelatinilyticus TaxID=2961597 RepID=UPI0020CA718D|nr:HD domain-containing protein [Halovivax gelatinilyticus]